jgi:hypothetical protein
MDRDRASLIDQYLAELRQAQWGNSSQKERLLWEVADHLAEGAEREQERGAAPEEAERRAIERFGLPQLVAQLYAAEIAANGGENMWQRFTERARRTVFNAQEEAKRLGYPAVGPEHLLLGMVSQKEIIATVILERLGISRFSVRDALQAQIVPGSDQPEEVTDLTPEGKRAIDLAYEEARRLKNNYIGTEHLLVSILLVEDGLGAKVLNGLGADLESVRRETEAIMARGNEIQAAKVRLDEARERLEEAEAAYRAAIAAA